MNLTNLRRLASQDRWTDVLAGAASCDWRRDEYAGVLILYLQAVLKLGLPIFQPLSELDLPRLVDRTLVQIARLLIEARETDALAHFLILVFSQGRAHPTLSIFAIRALKNNRLSKTLFEALDAAHEQTRGAEARRFPDAKPVTRCRPVDVGRFQATPAADVQCFTSKKELGDWLDFYPRLARAIDDSLVQDRSPTAGMLQNVFFDSRGRIWSLDGTPVLNFGRVVPFDVGAARAKLDSGQLPRFRQAVVPVKPSFGYYHWLAECLPSLAWLQAPEAPKPVIALPHDAQPFKVESLHLAGFEPERIVHFEGGLGFAEELFFGSEIYRGIESWEAVQPLYDKLSTSARDIQSPNGEKIYISRRDTNRRVMKNEAQLEARLAGEGFSILTLSKLSLPQKIASFRDARIIVGAHGAGLTHMLFANPGAVLLDILPTNPKLYRERRHFLKLCRLRRAHYVACIVQTGDIEAAWELDVSTFNRALKAAYVLADIVGSAPGSLGGEAKAKRANGKEQASELC